MLNLIIISISCAKDFPDLSAAIGNKLVAVMPGNVFSSRKKYLHVNWQKYLPERDWKRVVSTV